MNARPFVLGVLLLAGACANHSSIADGTATAVRPMAVLPAPTPGQPNGPIEADYLVGPLDTIDVSVYGAPDLTRTVQVDASGKITLPMVGVMDVRGKSTDKIGSEMAQKLSRYFRSPDVTVSVKQAMSQRITVEGAVGQAGVYAIASRTTLLQMIATARGLDPVADQRQVVILRTIDGQKMAAAFDVKRIRDGMADDPQVYGNDIIVVERSGSKSALRNALSVTPLAALFRPVIF